MNFPELCQRLKREKGIADVWCDLYPNDGTPGGKYILRVKNSRYEAGAIDDNRGNWVPLGSFDSPEGSGVFDNEEDACDVIYKWATWVAPAPEPDASTAEEIEWGEFTTQVRICSLNEGIPYKSLLARVIAEGNAPAMPESFRRAVWEPYQRSLSQDS